MTGMMIRMLRMKADKRRKISMIIIKQISIVIRYLLFLMLLKQVLMILLKQSQVFWILKMILDLSELVLQL